MKLHGNNFMFHTSTAYRGSELFAALESADDAEARARKSGITILAGCSNKPHVLRACMILAMMVLFGFHRALLDLI
jgi:hypothetical protein